MKYPKPPLSYDDQATLIEKRGMVIVDRPDLVRKLEAVGYYRLCAYWHPFKQPDDSFAPGTTFETVWERYRFDRQLRLLVMDAIERVEVAVRTALVHDLAMAHGPFVHVEASNFRRVAAVEHARFLDELHTEAWRSRELFIQHFRATYDEFPNLPLWAAAETMSFGTMFTLFRMTEQRIQSLTTRRFGLNGSILESWLRTLNYVRNLCAHHGRLWNRVLAIQPLVPDARLDSRWHRPRPVTRDRVFVLLTLLNYLLKTAAPQTRWKQRLFGLFDQFATVPIADMGMPNDWRNHALWQ